MFVCLFVYLFDNDVKKAIETTRTKAEKIRKTREVSKRGPKLNSASTDWFPKFLSVRRVLFPILLSNYLDIMKMMKRHN